MVSSGEKVERVCVNRFFYCYWKVPCNSYLRKIRFILAHSLRAYSSLWWPESEMAHHMCPVSWRTAMNAGAQLGLLFAQSGSATVEWCPLPSRCVSQLRQSYLEAFHRHAQESVSRVTRKHSQQWRGVITECERTSTLLSNSSGDSEIQVPLHVHLLTHHLCTGAFLGGTKVFRN